MSVRLALLAAIVAGSFLPSVASAQDPKFEKFEGGVTQGLPAPGTTPAPPPPKPVTPPPPPKVWTVQLKAGLLATTGNSQQVSVSASGVATYRLESSKLTLDGSWAYARGNPLVAGDANGNGVIDRGEFARQSTVTANLWNVRLRYDHFFLGNNSAYALAQIGADTVAGKVRTGGIQAGYSRILYKSLRQELVAELGYDFAFESYDPLVTGSELSANAIHSIRFFGQYRLMLTTDMAWFVNAEGLFNLNTEIAPTADGTNRIAPFIDGRFNGKTGLVMKVWKNISVGVNFTLKYDNRPAPLPVFNALTPFSPGFVPIAQRLDTITDAQLIITFL